MNNEVGKATELHIADLPTDKAFGAIERNFNALLRAILHGGITLEESAIPSEPVRGQLVFTGTDLLIGVYSTEKKRVVLRKLFIGDEI